LRVPSWPPWGSWRVKKMMIAPMTVPTLRPAERTKLSLDHQQNFILRSTYWKMKPMRIHDM
jgi:hypothetical protein